MLHTLVGCAGPLLPRLLDQARASAKNPSHMMMANYNDRDPAAPPLPPVTLPSLHSACMLPYRRFQEGPQVHTQILVHPRSVLEGNPLEWLSPMEDCVSPAY